MAETPTPAAVEIRNFEAAVDCAARRLGPAHPIVERGRAELRRLRATARRSQRAWQAGELARSVGDALAGGGSSVAARDAAASPDSGLRERVSPPGPGPGSPQPDAGGVYAGADCASLAAEMEAAAATGDAVALDAAVRRAVRRGLGMGHALVVRARRELEDLARRRARAELVRTKAAAEVALVDAVGCPGTCSALAAAAAGGRCRAVAARLTAAVGRGGEVAGLLEATRTAEGLLGAHHEAVADARARHRVRIWALGLPALPVQRAV